MNENELLIISHLRKNARETLTNLSKKTMIPISTIHEKLKKTGVINKHTCLLDFAKLGFNTRAKVMFKVDKEQREELKEHLTKHQNVNNVYKINNGFDFLIEGVFRHIKDLHDFIELTEEKYPIEDKQVYYIVDELKREKFMSDPETLNILSTTKNEL